jgi:hypothetical protein
MFGVGYLLAAFTYKNGPPPDVGGDGWPFWVMLVAFILIGMGTSCMYLSAVATCAKNYGRGKHKGIMLAIPIAAFGLSGMWQSQIGTYVLYERNADGSHGDLDVFRYFLFLGLLLLVTGFIGTFLLRIVDEEEERYIDETVEELERSGLLEESDFFRPRHEVRAVVEYGTFSSHADETGSMTISEEEREEIKREEEERRKKNWLLNYETRAFLQDPTMWWLAAGFFLVTGPGESYINNVSKAIRISTIHPNPILTKSKSSERSSQHLLRRPTPQKPLHQPVFHQHMLAQLLSRRQSLDSSPDLCLTSSHHPHYISSLQSQKVVVIDQKLHQTTSARRSRE